MKNKILKLSVLILLIILSSCSDDDQITGSGNIITETRVVNEFSKIHSTGSINIIIVHGNTQNVQISADDNVINNVQTAVNNTILSVGLSSGSYNNISITVTITVPNLSELQNTGSGNITASGFIGLNVLEIKNSGSGSISLNGSSINLNINNSGSGSINGFGFIVENCMINSSGSGSCEVNCNATLSGTNSGSGSVLYKGTPTINITNTGSGSIIDSN